MICIGRLNEPPPGVIIPEDELGMSFNIADLTDSGPGADQHRNPTDSDQRERMLGAEGHTLNDLDLPRPGAPHPNWGMTAQQPHDCSE